MHLFGVCLTGLIGIILLSTQISVFSIAMGKDDHRLWKAACHSSKSGYVVCPNCPGSWMDIKRIKNKPVCKFCQKKWPAPPGAQKRRPATPATWSDHGYIAASDSESDTSQATEHRIQFDREDDKHFAKFEKLLQKQRESGKGIEEALAHANAEFESMRKKAEEEENVPAAAMDDDEYHRLLGHRKQVQQTADRAVVAHRRKLNAMESSKKKMDAALDDLAVLEGKIDQQDQLRAEKKKAPAPNNAGAATAEASVPPHQTLLQHELLERGLLQGLDEPNAAKVRDLQEQLRAHAETCRQDDEARKARYEEDKQKCDKILEELHEYKKETHKETDNKKTRTEPPAKNNGNDATHDAGATASEVESFCSAETASGSEYAPVLGKARKAQDHIATKLRHQRQEQEIKNKALEEARARVAAKSQCS